MKNLIIYALSLAAWSAFFVTAALSQTQAGALPDTHVSLLPFYEVALPYILALFGAILTALTTWVVAQLQTRTSIRVSDSARERIQQAALNGAGRILAAQEGSIASMSIDVRSPLVAQEAARVAALVPDALAKIGVTPAAAGDVLSSLIAGKVGILQASSAGGAPGPVGPVGPMGPIGAAGPQGPSA